MSAETPVDPMPKNDLTGKAVGRYLTVDAFVRTIRDTDAAKHVEHLWRLRCTCGGSTILSAGAICSAIAYARNPSCRACRPIHAAQRRRQCSDLWPRDRMDRRLRRLWADGQTLYSEGDLNNMARSMRKALGLVDHYTGPMEIDTMSQWDPPREEADVYCRITGGMTLQEIADAIAAETGKTCSRERVRQIEAGALYKVALALYRLDPGLFNGRVPQQSEMSSGAEAQPHSMATKRARERRQHRQDQQ